MSLLTSLSMDVVCVISHRPQSTDPSNYGVSRPVVVLLTINYPLTFLGFFNSEPRYEEMK